MATFNGTSMATPHVAGCAAILKAKKLELTAAELKSALLASAQRLPALDDRVNEARRVNCRKALQALKRTTTHQATEFGGAAATKGHRDEVSW